MAEKERRIVDGKPSVLPICPPYYPDEDRQLASDLLRIAGELTDIASRVIEPDHYWNKPMPDVPEPPYEPFTESGKK